MFMCWNVNFKAALSLNFLVASESGSRVDHVPWKTLDQKISCYNVGTCKIFKYHSSNSLSFCIHTKKRVIFLHTPTEWEKILFSPGRRKFLQRTWKESYSFLSYHKFKEREQESSEHSSSLTVHFNFLITFCDFF